MKRFLVLHLAIVSCLLVVHKSANATDWPMYRCDAGRRGITQDSLPGNLSLAWVRELPNLTPAFKDERLQFDAGYEPVVANGYLLIASSRTDSVTAYDTKTGKQLWCFSADGPVRLAPAVSGDLACFGSDDGCLYCVELATGKLRWKYRAVPSQRRLLGNKRLISVWPVRGGPVVADGNVYFAAGVWPFEGVFVYAMEIESGGVLWRNDRLGFLFGQQPHNTKAIGGLAPQGYLVINGNELIVPCSNAYPARLNRRTGELIEFELPKAGRLPGYHVVVFDDNRDRVEQLRTELSAAGLSRIRATVVHDDLRELRLPPYMTTALISERSDVDFQPLLQTLRPFGGIAVGGHVTKATLKEMELGNFSLESKLIGDLALVRREGPLPGSTQYSGDFSPSLDQLVRFPLGVLWFDDTLAHFKRSPQPVFDRDTMISRPKNWDVPRHEKSIELDYPLLPPVLSDIYTGRILDESERPDLRMRLEPSSPSKLEPSQYRLPGQARSTKPGRLVAGERMNPLTGKPEPRTFPKTYGCDGGVDYGDFYTLRSGTAAYYDKTIESGTVFLSGPRSGCTNSIIPSGGLLNVPYYYDGCTCSYPLPTAMSLVAMPQSHEQWSSWGESKVEPNTIQRIGINFGAPGDRMTRDGTLWLDYPSVGGPSPEVNIDANSADYHYRHSVWMQNSEPWPWVTASMAEHLERFVIKDLKSGAYLVRLYFAEPETRTPPQRLQDIKLQGRDVLKEFDIAAEAGGVMRGIVKEFSNIEVVNDLMLELSATNGKTMISGIELLRQD